MEHGTKVLHRSVAPLLACLLCCQTCLAQVDAWERVKLIEPGKKVQVRLHSGKTVNGRMDTWSVDALSVRKAKKVAALPKSDVAQVALVAGMSRGHKAAWAGGITGGILGGLAVAICVSDCRDMVAAAAFGGAAGWAGIAAGIAALFPQHKEIIYRASVSPPDPVPQK